MKLDVGGYDESVLGGGGGCGGGGGGGSGGCGGVQDIYRLPCPSLTCPISHHDGKVRVGISLWLQTAARVGCATYFLSKFVVL